jgi:hypothetical protein
LRSSEKEFRGRKEIDNGAVYFGEWLDNMRHGKGVLLWKDGSKYEGYFKNNQVFFNN